jgi:long-subunit fatty acid transport protein
LYWEGKEKLEITLPQTIGGGISFSSEKYFIGFDFSWSEWSNFKMGEIKDTLKDSYKFSLGGISPLIH